jgi:hypothetical protein
MSAQTREMNAGAAAVVARVDLLKWWNALDILLQEPEDALRMARESQHPDARWLVSLLPTDSAVTHASLREVVLKQGDDPRGMYIAWLVGDRSSRELLTRAAEKGYAPALAVLSMLEHDKERAFELARRAADQGDRDGLYMLGICFEEGDGCDVDRKKAIESYRRAAELEFGLAECRYGDLAFDRLDWQRYHWLGRAAAKGYNVDAFCESVLTLLPAFKKSQLSRVLHTVGPVIRGMLSGPGERLIQGRRLADLQRILELHNAMLGRARGAIDCWSMAGRQLGLVKDMRVMIAKMAWEEAWVWQPVVRQQKRKKEATKR